VQTFVITSEKLQQIVDTDILISSQFCVLQTQSMHTLLVQFCCICEMRLSDASDKQELRLCSQKL